MPTVQSFDHAECIHSFAVKTSDLISLGNLKQLEILKLSKQIACKDEVLSTIAGNCPNLRCSEVIIIYLYHQEPMSRPLATLHHAVHIDSLYHSEIHKEIFQQYNFYVMYMTL